MPPAKRTLWQRPSAAKAAASNEDAFKRFVNQRHHLDLKDYWELHRWSIDNLNDFWNAVWDFTGIIGTKEALLFDDSVPMDQINPQLIRANLNFAENLLLAHSNARSNADAIISLCEPDGSAAPGTAEYLDSTFLRRLSFEELYQEVRKLAHSLREMGVRPGTVVAAFSASNAEAIVTALAAISLGAIFSSTPSEFGTNAVLERLTQIEPTVLLVSDQYRYNGKIIDVAEKVEVVLASLPTVKNVIMVGQLQRDRQSRVPFPSNLNGRAWSHYNDVIAKGEHAPSEIRFHRGSAMAPIWVLYSSGTTGKPKAIVHSHGGMILSQKMCNTIHSNFKPGDRTLQVTTLGWMMWNYAVSTLANGCCVCIVDGSPLSPRDILFQLVDRHQITNLGISPRYLTVLETAGYIPNQHYSLKSLKSMSSAGSPLAPHLYDYVSDCIGKQVWLNNGTGGTDICNLFVGGAPTLPVYHGEITCPGLGMDVQAWDDDGSAVFDAQGEMVITKPFPNMPLGFWGDEGNKRYKASYFEAFKQPVWTQGDWIEIHSQSGGVMVYGRSDGVLNPQGVRFGSAEIYSVVDEIDSVEDCLAVGQKLGDGDERVVLFVVPKDGAPLSKEVIKQISDNIRTKLSPRHIPAKFIRLDRIPYTTNGKRLEIPVKKLINGVAWASLNLSSAEDPEALKIFNNHPELVLPVKAKL